MVVRADQERVKTLLKEAIPLLCKNGLSFSKEFCIEALVGITLDQNDVFLVSIKETVKSDFISEDAENTTNSGTLEVSVTRQSGKDVVSPKSSKSQRKRRRSKTSSKDDGRDSDSDTGIPDFDDDVPEKKEKNSYDDNTFLDNTQTNSQHIQSNKTEPDDNDDDSEDAIIIKEEPVTDDRLSGLNFGDIMNQGYNLNQSATGAYAMGGASNLPYAQGSADVSPSTSIGQPSVMQMIPNVSQGEGQDPTSPGQLSITRIISAVPKRPYHRKDAGKDEALVRQYMRCVNDRDKPWLCLGCRKQFSQTSNIRKHIYGRHLKVPRITCKKCGENFLWYGKLQKHKLTCQGQSDGNNEETNN